MEKDKEKSNVRKGSSECNEYRQAGRLTDRQTGRHAHIDTATNTSIAATATHTIVLAVPVYNSDCCAGLIA